MNKNFNQSPETEESCNSQSDETPPTEVDEDSEINGAAYDNPRNDSARKNFHFQTEGQTEVISNGDRAAAQAEDYMGNGTGEGNGREEVTQELFQYRNDPGSGHPSSQEEHDIETILPHNSVSTETQWDQPVFIFLVTHTRARSRVLCQLYELQNFFITLTSRRLFHSYKYFLTQYKNRPSMMRLQRTTSKSMSHCPRLYTELWF
jgi:hypothetical protein